GLVPTVLEEKSALPQPEAATTPAISEASVASPVASPLPEIAPTPSNDGFAVSASEPAEAEAESDFEARVAKAMSAYSNSAESLPKEQPAGVVEKTTASPAPANVAPIANETEDEGVFPASKDAIADAMERSEAPVAQEPAVQAPSSDYHPAGASESFS